jgi:DNA-binding NarL/FixJ family response regulator
MCLLQGSREAFSRSISILVVEDFEPFRRLICVALRNWSQHAIIVESADGLESLEKARELQPSLVLIDIGLPRLNGIEVAKQIRRMVSDARLLFVSTESSVEIVHEAFRVGADGYVHKPYVHRDLVPAIETVLAGKKFLSSALKSVTFGMAFD